MSDLDFGEWLTGTSATPLTLRNIPSRAYPDGGNYEVPTVSAYDGVLLERMADGWDDGAASADATKATVELLLDEDGKTITLPEKLLGPAYEQMLADGVTSDDMQRVMAVMMQRATGGTEMARALIARGVSMARQEATGEGEGAARPNRAARRAPAKKTSSPRKAGSRTAPASGAKSTPSARATIPGSATSETSPASKAKTA